MTMPEYMKQRAAKKRTMSRWLFERTELSLKHFWITYQVHTLEATDFEAMARKLALGTVLGVVYDHGRVLSAQAEAAAHPHADGGEVQGPKRGKHVQGARGERRRRRRATRSAARG